MFYQFRQNNSGGSFDFDAGRGISVYVVIEADSAADANLRAELIGIYFDDNYDIDCECCGARWTEIWRDEAGDELPTVYSEVIDGGWKPTFGKWMGDNPEGYIHYKNGLVKPFGF